MELYGNYGSDNPEYLNHFEAAVSISQGAILSAVEGDIDLSAAKRVVGDYILFGQGVGGYTEGHAARSIEEAKSYIARKEPYILVVDGLNIKDSPYIKKAAGVVVLYDPDDIAHQRHSILDIISHHSFLLVNKALVGGTGKGARRLPVSGEYCSLIGTYGVLYSGRTPYTEPQTESPEFKAMLRLFAHPDLKACMPFDVGAIVNTLDDVKKALQFGADCISPVRSEFFLSDEGQSALHEAITSEGEQRTQAIARMETDMREQYTELFRTVTEAGVPISLRMLDAPLHKLLHRKRYDIDGMKEDLPHLTQEQINPRCARAGIRLGLEVPEIYLAQLHAIATAAKGFPGLKLDVCLPYLAAPEEMTAFETKIMNPLGFSLGQKEPFKVSTMIETPSAAIGADYLAHVCTSGLVGTGDLAETLFAAPTQNYMDQFVTHTHQGFHPILSRAIQTALNSFDDGDSSLIWHGPINYFILNQMATLPHRPHTIIVSPDQILPARLQAIQHGIKELLQKQKSAEPSLQ